MAKKAGFPDTYKVPSFSQPNAGDAKPALVGDYLDETTRPPAAVAVEPLEISTREFVRSERPAPAERASDESSIARPSRLPMARVRTSEEVGGRRAAAPTPTPSAFVDQSSPASFRPKPAPTRSQRPARSRMQFNMDLEVERSLEEIVSYFRSYAPQSVSASEVLSGLVLALKDALPHVEAQGLPERGQWGSDSHRQFPHFLKAEFLRSIARFRGRGE